MNPPSPAAPPGDSIRERHGVLLTRLLGSGQWERALSAAGDWLARDPEATPAHRGAAQALVNLGRYKLASPHLQKVLSANPDDAFAWRMASVADFYQRRYERAHENIQRALRLQPRNAWHWFHLALMRYANGGRRAAIRCAQRAWELAPNEAAILNLLASCEPHGSPQQLARYQDALKLDPGNAVIHNNVGEHFLHVEKDYARASEAFRRVLALDPSHRTAQENLFFALRELDPIRRALQRPDRLFDQYQRLGEIPGTSGALFTLLVMPWLTFVALALYLPWAVFGFPLGAAYDLLLKRDIRARVGVIGARRGGFLNFWGWPRWVRVGLLFFAYVVGWVGVLVLVSHGLRLLFQ